jgi:hypothetical protein
MFKCATCGSGKGDNKDTDKKVYAGLASFLFGEQDFGRKSTHRHNKGPGKYFLSKLREVVPTALGERLEISAKKEIERWRIGEIIDLFDFAVDGNVRGRMKQIVEYRNWVAHGKNPDVPPSSRTTEPKTTYDTIVDFITQ